MNIWSWVDPKLTNLRQRGENRLAELMDSIPSATVNDEHQKVDAYFAEGVALARQANEPWAELFIRHWYLQSQVLHRHNAKGLLNEAIELLDFSHQEETNECPQRICVVQDLAATYGILDGPGYSEERISVANEALASIDGSWPCYECVGTELAEAQFDAGNNELALQTIDSLKAEILKKTGELDPSDFCFLKSNILLKMGKIDEAVEAVEDKVNHGGGSVFHRRKALHLAKLYAHQKRYDLSRAKLLTFSEIQPSQTYFEDWCETQYLYVCADEVPVTIELLKQLFSICRAMVVNGANRMALRMYSQLCEISFIGNFIFSMTVAVEEMESILPELKMDLGAAELISSLHEKCKKSTTHVISKYSYKNESDISSIEFKSPEEATLCYREAQKKFPESIFVAIELIKLYDLQNEFSRGLTLVKSVRGKFTKDQTVNYYYWHFTLQVEGPDKLMELLSDADLDLTDERTKLDRLWLLARSTKDSDKSQCVEYLKEFLELKPGNTTVINMQAGLYMALAEYTNAIACWKSLIELDPTNNNLNWDLMVPASILGEWRTVRQAANRVGIEMEISNQPIDMEMGGIRLQFKDEYDNLQEFYAKRTGPVSAIVTQINNQHEMQRYHTEVVFDAAPLNQMDEKTEDGDPCDSEGNRYFLYNVVSITTMPEHHIITIDGVHPGNQFVSNLAKYLHNIKGVLSERSSDEYVIEYDPMNDGKILELPGWFSYILVPTKSNLGSLHDFLTEETINLEHPLIWPDLLEKLSLHDELERHLEIEERYGL